MENRNFEVINFGKLKEMINEHGSADEAKSDSSSLVESLKNAWIIYPVIC